MSNMKFGFIEKIKTEYRASKKETLLIWVIMLAVSVSIGLSCIMLNSQQIERSLMKNIDIKLEAEGGHIFDCKYSGELSTRKRLLSDVRGPDAFCSFYRDIVEFSRHKGIVNYGYSLGTDQTVLSKVDEELTNKDPMHRMLGVTSKNFQSNEEIELHRMLGVTSKNFQSNEEIELIEGRFFTDDEIENNAHKIVVDESITVDGEKIRVGDKLAISITGDPVYYTESVSLYQYYGTEAEVIGIYKYKTAFDMTFGKQDAFLNNHCILIPEGIMEEAILDQELLDYNAVFINNIWYNLENFDYYYDCNYDFYKMISTNSAKVFTITGAEGNSGSMGVGQENPSELKVKQNDYDVTMRSVDKTSNFYFIIFAVGTVTSVVLMAVMMTFILNKKIREINIYYSLGQNRKGIIKRYAGYYCAVGLIASVVGYAMAYGLSQILFAQLVRSSASVQAELAQLSNSGAEIPITQLELLSIRGSELTLSGVLCVTGLLVIVFSTVFISLLSILHGNMRDKINGGF